MALPQLKKVIIFLQVDPFTGKPRTGRASVITLKTATDRLFTSLKSGLTLLKIWWNQKRGYKTLFKENRPKINEDTDITCWRRKKYIWKKKYLIHAKSIMNPCLHNCREWRPDGLEACLSRGSGSSRTVPVTRDTAALNPSASCSGSKGTGDLHGDGSADGSTQHLSSFCSQALCLCTAIRL